MKRLVFSVVFTFLFSGVAWGWSGKVVGVLGGDSMTILHEGKKERICLYGIECPEREQDFGVQARQYTSDRVLSKEVEVKPITRDRYGCTVAVVKVGEDVLNRSLVEIGMAWVYRNVCDRPDCREWAQLEDRARKAQVGLWSRPGPIPPWEFKQPKKKGDKGGQTRKNDAHSASGALYHGNVISHTFHAPGCEEFNCRSCIAVFRNKEAALRAGYKPCEICRP